MPAVTPHVATAEGDLEEREPSSSTRRILLVDDEPRILRFLSRSLQAAGFEVTCATSGTEGLGLALRTPYDLVVLDLLLPGVPGVELLRRLLRHRPDQPVLVLSCLTSTQTKVECLELGAQDYMEKPFSTDELIARVNARLRAAEQSASVTTVGRIRLDLFRLEADAGKGPVRLAEREFMLLRELLRLRGRPASKERLLEAVWHYDFDPGTNVVDVYIRRLRRKLGDAAIETVRGEGYRINVT
jgi:two-component system copper resistance phosphate regulon response regulator CusR